MVKKKTLQSDLKIVGAALNHYVEITFKCMDACGQGSIVRKVKTREPSALRFPKNTISFLFYDRIVAMSESGSEAYPMRTNRINAGPKIWVGHASTQEELVRFFGRYAPKCYNEQNVTTIYDGIHPVRYGERIISPSEITIGENILKSKTELLIEESRRKKKESGNSDAEEAAEFWANLV
jgi:hypothetical protein